MQKCLELTHEVQREDGIEPLGKLDLPLNHWLKMVEDPRYYQNVLYRILLAPNDIVV